MRIAVSQRVDQASAYRETRDGLDQRWAPLLESLGLTAVPVPNGLADPKAWATELGIEGLLLTGGNDLASSSSARDASTERDHTERLLLELAQTYRWPALGVCRGMQKMNVHLGGSPIALLGHVAIRHRLHRTERPARLLSNPQAQTELEVNSFHGFGIDATTLASTLVPLWCDEEGFVEAVEHETLPWLAVMWHPEREASLAAVDRLLFSALFTSQ